MKDGAKIIGIAGVARAGKDTFAMLAKSSPEFVGKKTTAFAFADALKFNASKFLREFCNIPNLSLLNSEQKADVRPFLVWYGCYMRRIVPTYWVDQVAAKIAEDNDSDIFLITDVRFQNEVEWVHQLSGRVIHIKRFQADPYLTSLVPPANEEEAKNDPMVDESSDFHVRWPTVTDSNLQNLQPYTNKVIEEFIKSYGDKYQKI